MKKKIIWILFGFIILTPQGKAAELLLTNETVFNHFRYEIEAANIHTATTLSLLDQMEQSLGGDSAVPITHRLQTYIASLGLDATTIAEAVGLLQVSLERIPGHDFVEKINHLKRDLTGTTRDLVEMKTERDKEQASKFALQRGLSKRDEEQEQTKQLLHDILTQLTHQESVPQPLKSKQLPPIHPPSSSRASPLKTTGVTPTVSRREAPAIPPLSLYQQQLLAQREAGKIGHKAWELLGGTNTTLAGALFRSIQGCSGKTVEIYFRDEDYFKLQIDNKPQSILYKF